MCGITSIIGNYDINFIIDSLQKLQNRGYDSAGLSINNNSNFKILKELNKESIDNLSLKLNENKHENNFNNVIAHTRWATHGGITINNCHPHLSNNKKICLVHNGIIENYSEIKNFLLKEKFEFYSETDSEVIVNLIEYYSRINTFEEAILLCLNKCVGTWGLVIQHVEYPKKQFAIKNGSPLLIGKNENYKIITSETSGFNNLINNYHELLSNELYIVSASSVKTFNNKDILYDKKNILDETELLNEYSHYIIKEIYEQKNIVTKITNNGGRIKNNKVKLGGLFHQKNHILNCDNIVLFGCGTSYNSCLYSIYHFNKLCKFKNVIAIDACNYSELLLPKGKNCYIFISQSGETKDLYSVLTQIKNNIHINGITIGVINKVDSLIARTVDCGVYLNIGKEMSVASTKVFLAQSLMLVLIALYLSDSNKILYNNYINSIRNLESIVEIELNKKIDIENFNNGYILANNSLYPIALEGALKFKEITYSHIEALSINSLKHGPLALVSDNNFVNIILGKNESACQEILARNGKIINIIIEYNNIFNDLLYIIHIQRYNYLLSILKNINPDYPRNLAKVVTV